HTPLPPRKLLAKHGPVLLMLLLSRMRLLLRKKPLPLRKMLLPKKRPLLLRRNPKRNKLTSPLFI
ncbi:MAG: hypothetical protein LUG17_05540, partial [Clostridiales bacterium]|nr:hypothetical protein [Clostridiales bacterium]